MNVVSHRPKYKENDCRFNKNPGPRFSSSVKFLHLTGQSGNRAQRRADQFGRFRVVQRPCSYLIGDKIITVRTSLKKAFDKKKAQAAAQPEKKLGFFAKLFNRGNLRPTKSRLNPRAV